MIFYNHKNYYYKESQNKYYQYKPILFHNFIFFLNVLLLLLNAFLSLIVSIILATTQEVCPQPLLCCKVMSE
jgi:hypothetical protein